MLILSTFLNFFFLLTPFFVLLLYLDICKDKNHSEHLKIVTKTCFWILLICLIILFFGNAIFSFFGITLMAFQVGSGLILLISGMQMVQTQAVKARTFEKFSDPSLIPLALPITVGPGTIGALFVLGSNLRNLSLFEVLSSICGISLAVFAIWLLLYFSKIILKFVGYSGLNVLSKLTGLFLSILAVQSILNGIGAFLTHCF